MSFTIIREERITHSDNGLQLEDDLYIKLDTAFDELVAALGRGGQLSALIHIQLREAFASSGRGEPATLKTIAHAASCKERQAQRIVKSLLAKTLIAEAGVSPKTGEKFYRPLGYAWFGNRAGVRGVSSVTPQNQDADGQGVKCHPPVLVVDDVVLKPNELLGQQQYSDTRKLLSACGIFGKPLDRLAASVEPETARAWCAWFQQPHANLRNPAGVIVSTLLADPDARPALHAKNGSAPRVRKPTITGKLANRRDHA